MNSSGLVAPILTVLVAAISAGAALLGQRLSGSVSRREATKARALALRDERKQAILEFLDAVQTVEYLIDNWRVWPHVDKTIVVPKIGDWQAAPAPTGVEGGALVHKMWFSCKKVQLLCSADLAQAVEAYAGRATNFVWGEIAEEERFTNFLEEVRGQFIYAAKRELEIPQEADMPRRGTDR